ncbi:MAG: glycosyltransferase family 39 protein [Armatimonadetes bacterium]|nr:glycosyltransferase family 39 protein [Armatimonadota bacterium]
MPDRRIIGMLSIAVLSLVARFFCLEADFPAGVTASTAPFTDEGFWLNNAVSTMVRGHFYVEGDHNPAVLSPVVPTMATLVFRVLGMGLTQARAIAACFFVLSAGLVYLLARRYTSSGPATLSFLLFSTNYHLFVYSRLAMLEIPMMAMVLLSLVMASRKWVTASVLALAAAILTKATAVFALPLLVYVLWLEGVPRAGLVGAAAGVMVIGLGYQVVAYGYYPDDVRALHSTHIADKFPDSPWGLVENAARALVRFGRVDPAVTLLGAPGLLWLLLFRADFRRDPLVRLCLLWWLAWTVLLSLTHYQPTRYYLPYTVPLVVLFSLMAARLYRWRRAIASLFIGTVLTVCLSRVGDYLAHPQYTFRDMAHRVAQTVRQEAGPRAVLLGSPANSISLATGIPAVTRQNSPRGLDWKLDRYRPAFCVTTGAGEDLSELEQRYSMELLASYRVLRSPRAGGAFCLYRMVPR